MGRDVRGHTWPNNGQEYDVETLIRSVGPKGSITFLHQQVLTDPYKGSGPSGDNAGILGKIWGGWPSQSLPAAPEVFVHIRFYEQYVEDVVKLGVAEYARRVASMLQSWRGDWWIDGRPQTRVMDLSRERRVGVSVLNETNLWAEHRGAVEADQWKFRTPEHYRLMAELELSIFKALDDLLPGRECLWVSSAPAPGHDAYPDDPDSEWPVIRAAGLLDYVDLVGVHTYAVRDWNSESGPGDSGRYWWSLRPFRPVGWRDRTEPQTGRPADKGGVVARWPELRYFVTEWGNFACHIPELSETTVRDHDGFLRAFAESGAVVASTNFIWLSGREHQKNIVRDNKRLLGWYAREIGAYPTVADLPGARWRWGKPEPKPEPEPPAENPGGNVPSFNPNPNGYAIPEWTGVYKRAAELGLTILSAEKYYEANPKGAGRSAWSETLTNKGKLVWHPGIDAPYNVAFIPFGAGRPV